jgi:hypothetical protein
LVISHLASFRRVLPNSSGMFEFILLCMFNRSLVSTFLWRSNVGYPSNGLRNAQWFLRILNLKGDLCLMAFIWGLTSNCLRWAQATRLFKVRVCTDTVPLHFLTVQQQQLAMFRP